MRRHERPIPRVNPSGQKVWVARYTSQREKDPSGKPRRISAGTFDLRGACRDEKRDEHGRATCCAQHAIDAAYELEQRGPQRPDTFGAYFAIWTKRHPRSERTDRTNEGRVRAVLQVELEGIALADWPYGSLRRRHAVELLDVLLRVQGRAAAGAQNILRTLATMTEDAITDEVTEVNAFRNVRVRAGDPRVQKAARVPRVLSWEQSLALAAAAGSVRSPRPVLVPHGYEGPDVVVRPSQAGAQLRYRMEPSEIDGWRPVYGEAMIRVLRDCGLRLGELLGLERRDFDGTWLHLRGAAHGGVFKAGDQPTKRHVRSVPVPEDLAALLGALPARLDTRVLFPSPRGRLWQERNFYRDVWEPARVASGVDATPHDLRHSWVSLLRGSGVDAADLAVFAGHTEATATARYSHPLGRSDDVVRHAVGA